jgi:hypothetical protein
MKKFYVSALLGILLLNCSSISTTLIYYDDHTFQYHIDCNNMRDCLKEAAKECPIGYNIKKYGDYHIQVACK